MRRIAVSGLVALAAVLGGVAAPTAALAQPASTAQPIIAAQPISTAQPIIAARLTSTARPSLVMEGVVGVPLISCVLATDCLGVDGTSGLSDQGPSAPTRVARWNGSAWRGIRVTLPKGTKSADLKAVSCKGAKSCLVVGDYYTSTSQQAAAHLLALSYNGTALKPTPKAPLPRGTTQAVLTGVSCATTRYCVAVGVAYGDIAAFGVEGSLTLIDTWNGTRWTMHTAAESVGATTQLQPYAVSCPTIAFCVLDGESGSETSTSYTVQLYAASWNGRKLTTMKTVTVARSGDQALAGGVSCASSSNCALTGVDLGDLSGNAPSAAAVTEIWNGKTWQLAKVTWPKGMVDTFTLGVSCYAAHTCEVVGEDGANDAATSPFAAVAVSFKGTAGTLQAVPAPSKGHSNVLTAVSCLPWGGCVAAGETGKTSTSSAASMALMTGVLNGKAWKLDPGF